MKKKLALACTECGSRNYSKEVGTKVRTERLEIKKYCRYCKTHTLHRETK
ncbi:50S ribosomal protein L33 [Alkalibacterium sp. s-m-22]|jgi:large subunit ribosomal protein L33|uniref:Large ribosomal subunit protein bL33 n=1 Tax=Alkalibacterium indicireducens TaxID=398758 RepID=A0ABN1AV74_9LACT